MSDSGEEQREAIRPEFDRSIMIDFQGAKITFDTGFLLLRETDERFGILGSIESELQDTRSWVHSNHVARMEYYTGRNLDSASMRTNLPTVRSPGGSR